MAATRAARPRVREVRRRKQRRRVREVRRREKRWRVREVWRREKRRRGREAWRREKRRRGEAAAHTRQAAASAKSETGVCQYGQLEKNFPFGARSTGLWLFRAHFKMKVAQAPRLLQSACRRGAC